jgi:predicted metal-binding membrane protein
VFDAAVRRDRAVVVAGIGGVAALAWVYVARMGAMASPKALMGPMPGMPVLESGWALLTGMWAVMMVAMMLPSAAPTILLFAAVSRRRRQQSRPAVPVAVFTLGYLLVWTLYATAAATLQWELHRRVLLSPAMASASPLLGGALLVAAGLYQWMPLKGACLSHCRSPLGFFSAEWREGPRGALVMGMRHGSYCVGCCWLLMALLFVAGVMNVLWVAAIAAFVLVEKLVPWGDRLGRVAGVVLVGWGLWLVV